MKSIINNLFFLNSEIIFSTTKLKFIGVTTIDFFNIDLNIFYLLEFTIGERKRKII